MSNNLENIYNSNKMKEHTYLKMLTVFAIFTALMITYALETHNLLGWYISLVPAIFTVSVALMLIKQNSVSYPTGIYQIAQINHSYIKDNKEVKEAIRFIITLVKLPLKEYLASKSNPHVFITGMSGTRKSTLLKFITEQGEGIKIILSFKPNDIHLVGKKVIDVSKNPPNPFADVGASNSAFATAYHIVPDRRGYMATQTPTVFNEAMTHSKNFAELIKYLERETTNRNNGDVASGVLNLVRPLVIDTNSPLTKLDLSQDVVYDFSLFASEEAQVFYAELVLNMIWNEIRKKKRKLTISVDESQHLLAVPTTKLKIFLTEGRSLGIAVYCATPSFTNVIDDGLKENFATKFVHRQDNKETLDQLRAINKTLGEEIAHFATGEFTDVGFPNLKQFVPIFFLVQSETELKQVIEEEEVQETLDEHEQEIIAEPQIIVQSTTERSAVVLDNEVTIQDRILQVLDKNEESMAISQVAKALYKNEANKDEKDKVKLAVNNEVIKLVKTDILDKQTLVNEKGKVEKHCFRKNENLSKFHTTIQNRSVKLLQKNNITILDVANHQGIQGEDITLDNCVIECETGLKDSLGLFDKKVMTHTKSVIIVVPNYEQKERYLSLPSVKSGKARVVLLPELIRAVKGD